MASAGCSCASIAAFGAAYDDELTLDECLEVADQLAALYLGE